jgi:hypothetical protein
MQAQSNPPPPPPPPPPPSPKGRKRRAPSKKEEKEEKKAKPKSQPRRSRKKAVAEEADDEEKGDQNDSGLMPPPPPRNVSSSSSLEQEEEGKGNEEQANADDNADADGNANEQKAEFVPLSTAHFLTPGGSRIAIPIKPTPPPAPTQPSRKAQRQSKTTQKDQSKDISELMKKMPGYVTMNLRAGISVIPPTATYVTSLEELQRAHVASSFPSDSSSRLQVPQHTAVFLSDVGIRAETKYLKVVDIQSFSISQGRVLPAEEYEARLNAAPPQQYPYSIPYMEMVVRTSPDSRTLAKGKQAKQAKIGLLDMAVYLTDGRVVFPVHLNTYAAMRRYDVFTQYERLEWVATAMEDQRWFYPTIFLPEDAKLFSPADTVLPTTDRVGLPTLVAVPSVVDPSPNASPNSSANSSARASASPNSSVSPNASPNANASSSSNNGNNE